MRTQIYSTLSGGKRVIIAAEDYQVSLEFADYVKGEGSDKGAFTNQYVVKLSDTDISKVYTLLMKTAERLRRDGYVKQKDARERKVMGRIDVVRNCTRLSSGKLMVADGYFEGLTSKTGSYYQPTHVDLLFYKFTSYEEANRMENELKTRTYQGASEYVFSIPSAFIISGDNWVRSDEYISAEVAAILQDIILERNMLWVDHRHAMREEKKSEKSGSSYAPKNTEASIPAENLAEDEFPF